MQAVLADASELPVDGHDIPTQQLVPDDLFQLAFAAVQQESQQQQAQDLFQHPAWPVEVPAEAVNEILTVDRVRERLHGTLESLGPSWLEQPQHQLPSQLHDPEWVQPPQPQPPLPHKKKLGRLQHTHVCTILVLVCTLMSCSAALYQGVAGSADESCVPVRRARILKDGSLTLTPFGASEAVQWQHRVSSFLAACRQACLRSQQPADSQCNCCQLDFCGLLAAGSQSGHLASQWCSAGPSWGTAATSSITGAAQS